MDNPKHSKRIVPILFIASAALSFSNPVLGMNREKPRIIATTDGEIDDRCSMVRFLMYANEWDIEGIVISSSKFHWKGHNWAGETWIDEDIDLYAKSYENLKRHDPDFPSPDELKKLVYIGNIDNVGEMGKDTPGSDRLVQVLLDDEPGPVYLQAWGGTNTIARALWKIQHDHPDQMEKVSKKAIIYIILDQDKTFRQYIQPNWPDIMVLGSFRQFGTIAYGWQKVIPQDQHEFYDGKWMKENILQSHGPLCASYEAHNDGRFRSEGDSPAFMHQILVGLRSLEHPTYGGWGGRFVKEKDAKNTWRGAEDDGSWSKPIWRWSEAFQNDWAARADWCVKPYDQANHAPVVKLAHAPDLKARPGQKVSLSAKGSEDPDGDALTYRWWQYQEADTYDGAINIVNAGKQDASFTVPGDAGKGETIHIICEVTDDGMPPLTRYQRVICNISVVMTSGSIATADDETKPATQKEAEAAPIADKKADGIRPRVIATTDGEVDDMNSFKRFLYYTNEFDVEGLIFSSSRHRWAGDDENPARGWRPSEWIHEDFDDYAKIYDNLLEHDSSYPSPEFLKSLVRVGNIGYVGEMDRVTEGSVLIREILLDDKPGPVYVQVWGGANTLARALKCIEEEYKGTPQWQDIYDKVIDKTIVYIISDQDATYLEYILPNWPDIKTIYNRGQYRTVAYSWQGRIPEEYQAYMDGKWHAKNIKFNRGPLLERYYLAGDGQTLDLIGTGYTYTRGDLENARKRGFSQYDFISEGDSPSFFYLLDFEFGLRNVEDPAYGGLGGRFVQSGKHPSVWADIWKDVPRVSDFNP
jgi:hypothetical protein